MKALYMVAMKDYEAKNIFHWVKGLKFHKKGIFDYYENSDFSIISTGIGKVNASAAAEFVLNNIPADSYVNVGLVGMVDPNLKVGQILSVDKSMFWDVDVTAFDYPLGQVPGNDSPVYELKNNQKLKNCVCLTGDTFVTSKKSIKALCNNNDSYVVDMELASLAHVFKKHKKLKKLSAVKAGIDYVNKKSAQDFYEREKLAFANITEFVRSNY